MDFMRDTVSSSSYGEIPLSGKQKAAILIGELGLYTSDIVKQYLTDAEWSIIKKELKNMGTKYNPYNPVEVQRELQTLQEVEKFGKNLGIYKEVPHYFQKTTKDSSDKFANLVKENPNAIANVISSILREE